MISFIKNFIDKKYTNLLLMSIAKFNITNFFTSIINLNNNLFTVKQLYFLNIFTSYDIT